MDLTQAEAVNDIIKAHTNLSLSSALNQLNGSFRAIIENIHNDILELLSVLEAAIDHSDIEEVFLTPENLIGSIRAARIKIGDLLKSAPSGKIIRDGMIIAIGGAPNTGKSSLMNALLHKDRCIVTDMPGTTRDSIEDDTNVMGVPVRLIDTAGIRETCDEIELMGVKRAIDCLEKADIRILIFDSSRELSRDDISILSRFGKLENIFVLNKTDLKQKTTKEELFKIIGTNSLLVSAIEFSGLDELEKSIRDIYFSLGYDPGKDIMVTNIRHENLLQGGRQLPGKS